MKVKGSCTLYQDIEINPVDVVINLRKQYFSSLGFSSKPYLDSNNMWCCDIETDHGSPITNEVRKATQEEINMMVCFDKPFSLTKEI